MRMTTIIFALLSLSLLIGACGDHDHAPTSPLPGPTDKAIDRGPAQPSQQFLAALHAAYAATTWERVQFQEITRGGSQLAFPKSFPHGEFLQLTVNLQRGGPREVPPVEVYVPTTMQSAPGHCLLFKYEGTIEGAEYVIRTFLPAWYDELDLGPYHHTYRLVTLDDGTTYAAEEITTYATAPTPWASPPVEFTLLPHDPGTGEVDTRVMDPREVGDD